MVADDDKREFFRCQLAVPFRFSILHKSEILGPFAATTVDLGGGGMLFKTSCPLLQPGNLILAEFDESCQGALEDDIVGRILREVDAAAEGVEINDQEEEKAYLLAVAFKFPHKSDRNDVVAFLNRMLAGKKMDH